jgi:hypothetical protein
MNNRKNRNGGGSGGGGSGSGGIGSGSSSSNSSAAKGLWPSYFNPWTSAIQMWSSPLGGGVGIRQPHLRPQAMLADALPYGPLPQVGPPFMPPLTPLSIH